MFDQEQARTAAPRAPQPRPPAPERDGPAAVPAPACSGRPAAPADGLSQTLGLAVAARVAQPSVGHAGSGLLQRTPETDMTADPEGFFRTRIVSLDYAEGLRIRAPELQNLTARGDFVKAMGDFDRHWFRLVPNAARTTEDVPAYILTPAIERYVQAFPGHRLLAPLVGNAHLPAVAAEGAYLRAAYVPYLTKKASDPETDVGHVDVRIRR
jgi:hypothetical protein